MLPAQVSCVNPLRVYVHGEGVLRLASQSYDGRLLTLDSEAMHRTDVGVGGGAPSAEQLRPIAELWRQAFILYTLYFSI